jgi:hypothetical protein
MLIYYNLTPELSRAAKQRRLGRIVRHASRKGHGPYANAPEMLAAWLERHEQLLELAQA